MNCCGLDEVDANRFASERSEEDVGATCRTVPCHPQYETLEARRQSFPSHWNTCQNLSRDKMAEAGFFFADLDKKDGVFCFHCGLLVWAWEPNDLPLTEHVRLSNNTCEFTRQILGDDEVEKTSKSLKEKEAEDALSELREMKNTRTDIENALEHLQKAGGTINTNNMLDAIEALRRSREGANAICTQCKTAERQIMFLPCNHTVSCAECARGATGCFCCQIVITGTVRVYFS